jgi:hypothetical protein
MRKINSVVVEHCTGEILAYVKIFPFEELMQQEKYIKIKNTFCRYDQSKMQLSTPPPILFLADSF